MPRSRHRFALPPARSVCLSGGDPRVSLTALLAGIALLTLATSGAGAQTGTPLHLAAERIDFVESGDAKAPAKPLRIHNGGKAQFTDVRLVRVAYADSARGAAWLVSLPRQTSVAPDELATIGTLCADAAGLPAGTYRATAAVMAREVPEPVSFTIVLVVNDAGAKARHAPGRCGNAGGK